MEIEGGKSAVFRPIYIHECESQQPGSHQWKSRGQPVMVSGSPGANSNGTGSVKRNGLDSPPQNVTTAVPALASHSEVQHSWRGFAICHQGQLPRVGLPALCHLVSAQLCYCLI